MVKSKLDYFVDIKDDSFTLSLPDKKSRTWENLFQLLDDLNNDSSHFNSRDDICTPMKCVKKWLIISLKIFD
ncbi:hypothetical protein [Mycoplasma struthionis]|uniref:Uncharacterized protein n=1 Tax=Mycoplasma struthionis TaxID=538220 RepID=A0A3G8LG63_9MOLU|nr:hypothetical protein [Mycoplasma struthionis]AZG68649.1 hypothetical protein EGN60_01550 [Mycoplasma struthionis]